MPTVIGNGDLSVFIKKQIEDAITPDSLTIIVRQLPDTHDYEIRIGDGYSWAMSTVDAHEPPLHGWKTHLAGIVHTLIHRYAIERFLRK